MAHCDGDQVERVLGDLTRSHRLQGHRASQREPEAAFVQLQRRQMFLDGLASNGARVLA